MTTDRLTPEQRRRVERTKPLVDRMARGMVLRLSGVSEDELRSTGYEALVRCGLRYDAELGIPFSAFCHHRIRGAMIDAARRAIPALRRRSRAMRTMAATQALLEQTQAEQSGPGHDPRTLKERVDAAAQIIAKATTAIMLAHLQKADPERVADARTHDLEGALDDARARAHVRRVVAECSEDERAIIEGIYQDGLSMSELGQRLGRSKSTVSRRHSALLQRLSEQLQRSDRAG